MYNAIYDTLIIAKKLIYLPSCHSTNDIATELVRENSFQEGTVVITDNQTKGKGQRGNSWLTQPGLNLTFSIILRPNFIPIQDQFLLSKIVALGICSYLKTYSDGVKIKWPNDIYLGDKKLCGILIENSIQGTQIASSVIGIGVNINQSSFDNDRATSLSQGVGRRFSLEEEFIKIVHHLDAVYFKSKSQTGVAAIDKDYLLHMYGYHQDRLFKVNGTELAGRITGVTSSGKLMIAQQGTAGYLEFDNKEIEWLWEK